jgi:uncharacterized protein (DUF305 family)
MCAGVRDRPVRRLLAWLLTLSASASVAGRPCARQPPPSRTLRRHQLPYLADCDPVDRVNLTLIRTTLMAAVVALTIALIGCSRGNDAAGMPSEPGATPPGASASAAGQFNDADVMFAQQMILRHEQAVAMSDMVLRKTGVHPEVTALAQQVKATQPPEIDQLNSWLDAWGSKQVDDGGQHHGGQGTITAEKMRRLDRADGPGGQRLFLQSMIRHHQGAVAMAETEIAEGRHPAAIQLAETIAKRQQQEIETMQELLTNL